MIITNFRVRVVEDKFYPPADKWGTYVYNITYPKGILFIKLKLSEIFRQNIFL
jgi:hypothetical protein